MYKKKGDYSMKATFEDFIKENPNCSGFYDLADARELFNLLSKDENIIKMIEISEMKKPALVACLNDIHEWYENKGQCELNLLDSFTKTVVGRMIKSILAPFGYRVTKQKDIPKAASKKYFSSASCYELLAPEEATLHIVKRIEVK